MPTSRRQRTFANDCYALCDPHAVDSTAAAASLHPQDTIEGKLEKRAKGVFVPAGGKRLIAFIDDLNMPKKSKFGFIPPLELLKLWVDNGYW